MRRHALGIIALLLISTGGVLLARFGIGETDWSMTASICLRAGLTLGAIWLAFPQVTAILAKIPRWLLLCLVAAVATLVIRPKALLYVGPILAALAALQFVGWLFTPYKSSRGGSADRGKAGGGKSRGGERASHKSRKKDESCRGGNSKPDQSEKPVSSRSRS